MTRKRAGPLAIGDETVIEKTGKSPDEWHAILDAWDAPSKGHPAIARYLEQDHGLSGWWAQSVTVRYEYARGLRKDAVAPDDLLALLGDNEHARERFERLSAGHRREYIQWIIGAKRPETRARRLATTIERLSNEPIDAPSRSPR
ncbi:MAG: YdeI/OmpD-associated family protein [Thermomicrobiales bacterium]